MVDTVTAARIVIGYDENPVLRIKSFPASGERSTTYEFHNVHIIVNIIVTFHLNQ